MENTIKLTESNIKELIKKIISEGYDNIPISNVPDNVTIKSSDAYQMLQDMYAFNRFFEEIKPLMRGEHYEQLSANFGDKVRRLKRSVKILEKLV